jgi:2-oxoglutarate/2-oxoacid ferredoxin oxidoreductase subunit beta
MVELKDFNRQESPNWCPGCGNFGIIVAVKNTLTELNFTPENTVLVSGVGCFAKLPYWVRVNGFVGLHGRSLPVAQGAKLANPNLNVIAFGGDGDGYGEGGNHFLHACRRNVNITYIVHNNSVFGLTTGQYSPTAEKGRKSKSSLLGSTEQPVNPLALAIASGATFVARAYAGNLKETVEIMKKAIQHQGFAFVDVIQPCPSYMPQHDLKYFQEQIVYVKEGLERSSKLKAMELAFKDDKIYCGIIYSGEKE